jgi:hypothetical protein
MRLEVVAREVNVRVADKPGIVTLTELRGQETGKRRG